MMTSEELKALLETPAALFVVMILGSIASMLKQLRDAKVNGGGMSFTGYLAKWPETLATLIGNCLAFALLIVTDQLNFGSALGVGYIANSASDLLRGGGRSRDLAQTVKQGGFANVGMLVAIAAAALVLLSGCQTPGGVVGAPSVSPATKQTLEVISRIVVRRALTNSPRYLEKAQNIRDVIEAIGPIDEFTTVTALRAAVDHQVAKLNLTGLDAVDADELLDLWQEQLSAAIEGDTIDADALVKVDDLLQSILRLLPPASVTN
jgi:hypothetical protein